MPTEHPVHRELGDRVRAALDDRPELSGHVLEKQMFGQRAFMVRAALLATVGISGLVVRCDPQRAEALLGDPRARRAVMGGRSMGAGWLMVDVMADTDTVDETVLEHWIENALEFNGQLHG